MKVWVFLQGGYYNGTLYGVMEEKNLPSEILLHHYENPRAKMQGVTILGITKKGPDDITLVESYVRGDSEPMVSLKGKPEIYYIYNEQVDPGKVRKVIIDPDLNEYVLERTEIDE